jgi:hypothetical protein
MLIQDDLNDGVWYLAAGAVRYFARRIIIGLAIRSNRTPRYLRAHMFNYSSPNVKHSKISG